MAANPFDFMKYIATASQAQNAKYGTGGMGSAILQGLGAALPNSPLFRGLAGVNQALNVSKYNKAIQDSAERQFAYDAAMKQAQAGDRSTYVKNATGLDVSGYGDAPTTELLQGIAQANQNPNIQAMLEGKPLDQAKYGAVNSDLIKDYMGQISKNANSQATMGLLDRFLGPTAFGGQPGATVQTPAGTAQMDTTGPLQASARMSDLFNQNPYGAGNPDLAQLLNGRQNEQTDRRGNRTIDETIRSNKADEIIKRILASNDTTKANAAMVSARKPSGGGGSQPNEAAMAYQAFKSGLLTPEQYAQTLGAKPGGAMSAPSDKTLKYLDTLEKQATGSPAGLFGIGGSAPDPAKAAKYNALAPLYGLPQIQAGAFGGQSKANLQAAPSSFANWKKGKK
jgi:hypothetical protein